MILQTGGGWIPMLAWALVVLLVCLILYTAFKGLAGGRK